MQCEHNDCEKSGEFLIGRKGYDVLMCWEHHQKFIESEADYAEYMLEDR